MAGIREALREDPSLSKEQLPVIFIAHSDDPTGRKRTRKLFSTLNRRAKPVGQNENIALDEDDVCSIITREVIQEIPLFMRKNIVNRIPLVWQMYGHCDVDADSQEDAIEIALGPDTPLPDGFYVEDPVAVDYEVLELDQDKKINVLTKQELKLQLQQGHTLNDLLAFGPGQDCEIFKADKFYPGDVVIYVPDVTLNHIPLDRSIMDPEEFSEVLSNCYTGQDFINECHGDAEKAEHLFWYCDWQHPSSAVDELDDDEEDTQ